MIHVHVEVAKNIKNAAEKTRNKRKLLSNFQLTVYR